MLGESFNTILRDGVIETQVVKNAVVELNDALENTEKVVELSEGILRPILVDMREIKSISKEARDHFSMKGRKPNVSAVALVVKSPVSKMIGNFFINFSSPAVPTKLFTSFDSGLEWTKKYRSHG